MSYFVRRAIRRDKMKLLAEVEADLLFLEMVKGDLIHADVQELRNELKAEKAKDEPDENVLEDLGRKIAQVEAVKRERERLLQMKIDLPKYIALI